MKPSHTVRPVFDDPNLVSAAGLVPALRLAESAGLYELLEAVTVPSPNASVKTSSVVGGMLAGADSIDDMDLLRHGGMGRLFGGVRAPSTLGTFLRSFTHGHVQQLDKVGAGLLAGLTERVPGLFAGAEEIAFLDVDDTVREVHGYAKQGAAFGYTGVRGLNLQLATISTPTAAPVIARARLRKGNTASATGVGRLLAQAINTARAAGVTGRILARADSAYYGWAFVGTALRHKTWFSVTARMTPSVTAAITSISPDAWKTIEYPNAVYDEAEQRWVSDAEVAEVPFVAFTGRRKREHVACRLVVRRVRRLQPLASDETEQGELFATYRHHAFITNSTVGTIEADQRHRDHALIEQVIAELKDGPLAHLPSGKYAANAAWVACAVIGFNIARATAVAAAMHTARWATLRSRVINIPARIAATGRRLVLHLPTHWPWAPGWESLWSTATGPPHPVTT
ncbi:IS1380 family transposase [Nocardioides sp. SOB44]|uniref:IS1380 family transposase n=1 Tax=Nocardioides cremeus TaxID=3058044 RepID=A0ABT8TXQ9_9ACTN|nr:IS1380 family transposase [Nocardioides cremeus]MDO3398144.1 IS1380 family transposase [Nocardioides cremeus]